VAGYSLGQADILRRAMGKKIKEEMQKERQNFLDGARGRGYSEEVANKLWEYIEPFAGYAFNKAHSACYALIAHQTAYLKANFPPEWMAAVLTTDADNTDKVVSAIGECRRLGIELLRPDVNRSQPHFTVERISNGTLDLRLGIRYGLAAVKNVGAAAVESVIAERERGGPFSSLDDFCHRVDLKTLNKRVIESFVKCGAMDDFGPRERLLAAIDQCIAAAQHLQRAAGLGQGSLFDVLGADGGPKGAPSQTPLPAVPPVGQRERLAWEKETLGLFFSDHPFQEASRWLAKQVTPTAQLSPDGAGEKVKIGGVVSSVKRITTKSKKELMAVVVLEDLHGALEVTVFPRTYARTEQVWREDAVVIVEGKLDVRDERLQVICEEATVFEMPDGPPPELPAEPLEAAAAPSGPPTNGYVGSAAANGSNGHRPNGSHHGPPNGRSAVAAPAPPPPPDSERPPDPVSLVITVKRTGSAPSDIQTLERLHALLPPDGPDAYEIVLAAAQRAVRISNPLARTRYSPELEEALVALLGRDGVRVRERGE